MPRAPRLAQAFALVALSASAACGPSHRVWHEPTTSPGYDAPVIGESGEPHAEGPRGARAHGEANASATAPKEPLTLAEARKCMVEPINADRKVMGLPPVALDEGAPTRAGQGHAEEMAAHAYLGHFGLDGSVPEQRLTDAGGDDMVLENASCFTDERSRSLDPEARIDPREIEHTESMFFHQQPPNDGHRRNILKAWHTKVGIGIAQPRRTPTGLPVPCFTQEFVDDYGAYSPLPKLAHVGDRVRVEGELAAPAKPMGVGVARVAWPKRIEASDANGRRSYTVPQPYEMYWTPGFITKIPLVVKGEHFSIDVPLDDHGKPGMYEISVWARLPGAPDPQIVSLRTLRVDARE